MLSTPRSPIGVFRQNRHSHASSQYPLGVLVNQPPPFVSDPTTTTCNISSLLLSEFKHVHFKVSLIGQNYYLYDTKGGIDWTEAKSARKNRSESKPWFRAPCLLGAFELLSEEPSLPAMTIRSVGACKRRVRRRLRSGMARWKARFLRAGALWRNSSSSHEKPIVTCPTSLGRKGAACS